jgi:hypothetical protein
MSGVNEEDPISVEKTLEYVKNKEAEDSEISGGELSDRTKGIAAVVIFSFIVTIIAIISWSATSSKFAPIRAPDNNTSRSIGHMKSKKEGLLDKLPRNAKHGINERNISRFLVAPDGDEYARISIDAGELKSDSLNADYTPVNGAVEQSVIDSHREWADNTVIASAGANSKFMIRDDKVSLNTRIGWGGFRSRVMDVYTDEGARVEPSEYPDQMEDSEIGSMQRSISKKMAGQ